MDLLQSSEQKRKFVSNISFITSSGPWGDNIMTAELIQVISFSPGIIAVSVMPGNATAENISATKEFGVNLATNEQNVLSSIAGRESARLTDKIAALKELGYKFIPGKKIKVSMLEDSLMKAECKVIQRLELGDHILFIGEVAYLHEVSNKDPLIYTQGKYFKLGPQIPKPPAHELEEIDSAIEKYVKA